MIEAVKITKFFPMTNPQGNAEGITAVLSVSLKIEEGEFVTIIGPSGCGKSTFFEILAGLQAPTEGEVYIDGKKVLEPLPSTRKEIEIYQRKYRFLSPVVNDLLKDIPKFDTAMIFQDYAIFPWMTALENVLFALKVRGIPKKEAISIARKYLDIVGLNGVENKYPSQLSGGMRQRVALARALSVEPKIILMDEPFAAVDAMSRQKLQEDLIAIWQKTRKTIVFVTHDIDEAVYLSDRIVVFSSSPGTIRNIIDVKLNRPRNRFGREEQMLKERIMQIFKFDATGEAIDYVI
ncbi:MAG: ABC transporter ATP-binding protein [Methanobacteriaceae archaeon]